MPTEVGKIRKAQLRRAVKGFASRAAEKTSRPARVSESWRKRTKWSKQPELGVSIEKFLDDPMTKPQGGEAAAASKASP